MNNQTNILHTKQFRHMRDVFRELVVRDIKIRYSVTALGFAWTLAKPLFFTGVFVFLFQYVLELDVRRFSGFVLTGILIYGWFQSSISQAANVVVNNRDLVRQPNFPMAILPVVPVATNLIDFLVMMPVLALVVAIGGSQLRSELLVLPLVIVVQFLLTLGLAYLVAATNVVFRDMGHVVDLFLRLFFFLTPIFYDQTAVPQSYRIIFLLNPLVPLLDAHRAAFIGGNLPSWTSLASIGLLSLALTYLGRKVFIGISYRFVEEL